MFSPERIFLGEMIANLWQGAYDEQPLFLMGGAQNSAETH